MRRTRRKPKGKNMFRKIIDKVISCLRGNKLKREIVINYAVGDMVRIVDGPLENFTGKVEEIDAEKSKVRVIVSMFGRETPVELELDQAEQMD